MTLVDDLPMDRAATEAIASLAFITALLGRPAEAIALAERGLVLARDHNLADREVRCLNARGAAVLLQGNIEGYNDFMRALTRALEAGLGHESAMAYHNLAELQLQGVGTASSIELNERGLDLAERRGLTLAADWLRANRVSVFFEAGRWDEALALAAQVIANETRSGPGQAGTMCAVWSARIHVWRGELDHAIRLMDTYLPRARQHAVIQQVGPALIVAGLIMTASGRADEGAAYAEEYCALTEGTRAYRHMEMADVVRLLVAASRPDACRVRRRQRGDPHVPQRVRVAHRRRHDGVGGWRCRRVRGLPARCNAVEVVRAPARRAPRTRLGGRHPAGPRCGRAGATARGRSPTGEGVCGGAVPASRSDSRLIAGRSTRSRPVRNRPLSRST